MGVSSITWWMGSATNGQAMYQRQRRVSVNFSSISFFCLYPAPSLPGKSKEDPHPTRPGSFSSRIWLVQPLLFFCHFPEDWCHSRATGNGGVKNNINKLNRKAGGWWEGLRSGVQGREEQDLGSQSLLAFSHQSGKFCKRKWQRWVRGGPWPGILAGTWPWGTPPPMVFSLDSRICCRRKSWSGGGSEHGDEWVNEWGEMGNDAPTISFASRCPVTHRLLVILITIITAMIVFWMFITYQSVFYVLYIQHLV